MVGAVRASAAPVDPDNVGEYLISARSFAEYRAMFELSDGDLRGRILDCPAGGSSFTALAAASGARPVAVDPVILSTDDCPPPRDLL